MTDALNSHENSHSTRRKLTLAIQESAASVAIDERIPVPAKALDEKGRCCGRKPIIYKRPPHLFCHRCCADYDMNGQQIENWAFKSMDGGRTFAFVFPHMEEKYRASRESGQGPVRP